MHKMVTRHKVPTKLPEFGRRMSVALVGNSTCGKTTLALASVGLPSRSMEPTIGSDSYIRAFQNYRDQEVRVNIWDLSGSDKFILVRQEFYKESQAVLLCFDIGNRISYEALETWAKECAKYGDARMFVVGLKSDGSRAISETQAKAWAASKGLMYIEVSARLNEKVDELWRRVIDI
eukprot:GEMP01062677.1.p1 GENE.GEMP01062677.1~~GEMP01062677.1.p1  ORF type:complete len:189 (+),score=33.26 GEMP01062677.1:37-567(+)